MHLVYNKYFIFRNRSCKCRFFNDRAYIINAIIRRSIDLRNIKNLLC